MEDRGEEEVQDVDLDPWGVGPELDGRPQNVGDEIEEEHKLDVLDVAAALARCHDDDRGHWYQSQLRIGVVHRVRGPRNTTDHH